MKISPITSRSNSNSFGSVNKKYYDKALYGIRNYGTYDVLSNVKYDVQNRKISALDAKDTVSLLKEHISQSNLWLVEALMKYLDALRESGF